MSRLLLPSLLVLLALAGCLPRASLPQGSQIPELTAPLVSVTPGAATVVSLDPPGSGARVGVRVPVTVTNPGSRPLELRSFGYTPELGATPGQAGRFREHGTLPLVLAPGATIRLSLLLSGDLRRDAALLQEAAAAFRDGNPGLAWSVRGTLTFTADGHPFTEEQEVNLSGTAKPEGGPELPELQIRPAESAAWDTGAQEAHVRLVMEARNPGPVGYLLQARDLRLFVDGLELAGQALAPVPLAAGESAVFALPFRLGHRSLSAGARTALSDLLSGREVEVTVQGELQVDVLGLDSFRFEAEPALGARFNAD